MFTVCPKCALTLLVTAADLRVAQGYVRCGRCSSVFNALAQLSDDRQAPGSGSSPSAAAAPPREPRPSPAPAKEDPIPEDALEFDASRTDVNSVFIEPAPDPQWTAATGSFKAMRAFGEEARGPPQEARAPPPDAHGPPPDARAPPPDAPVEVEIDTASLANILHADQPRPGSPVVAAAAPAAPAAQSVEARGAAEVAAVEPRGVAQAAPVEARGVAKVAAAAVEEILPAPHPLEHVLARPGTRGSARWAAGAAALLVVLAAQVVNHSRDVLATHARLTRPLTALYSALGVPLRPRWDLLAYDVRQLGASGGAGELTVRASIRNSGRQPQPLPLLRVTLQDRFGTPLASRDVAPREYLPGAAPASAFLSVDQRIDVEMAFVDPGSRAVGFEIDACLPAAGGVVACANDPGSR